MENTEFEKRAAELMRRLNDPSIVTAEELEDAAVEGLYRLFPHYSWVGIYWLEGEMLKVGKMEGQISDRACGNTSGEGHMRSRRGVRQNREHTRCGSGQQVHLLFCHNKI
ncbi:MAG: hypothetical protein M1117_03585 [Candidatus Thermoplasmatota archaeon]|nr:hypothetical protein [Candidatus Thermoplasmatota archaeon]